MTGTTYDKKKRPRPANLELESSNLVLGDAKKSSHMNEFALKCVSPGLPPLSAKMKSTVLISKSIEAQQRQIIATRNASATISRNPESIVSEGEDDEENEDNDEDANVDDNKDNSVQSKLDNDTNDTNDDNNDNGTGSGTPSSSTLTSSLDDLAIPSANSNKRFKRDKAPPPLNLSETHTAQRPIIKSAPIYNYNHSYFTPATSRRSTFKQKKLQSTTQPNFPSLSTTSTLNTGRQRLGFTPMTPFDPNLYQRRPVPITANPYINPYANPYANPLQFRGPGNLVGTPRIAPKTATASRNPALLPQRSVPPMTPQQLERYNQQLAYQQQQWAKFKAFRDSKKINHVTDVFEGDATRYAPPSSQPLSAQRAFFNLDDIKPQAITKNFNIKDNKIAEEEESADADGEDGDDPESNAIEPEAEVGLSIRKNPVVRSELKLENNTFRFDFGRSATESSDNDKQRFLSYCALAWDQFSKMS